MFIGKDAECGDFARKPLAFFVCVAVTKSKEYEQSCLYLAHNHIIDINACMLDSLDDRSHRMLSASGVRSSHAVCMNWYEVSSTTQDNRSPSMKVMAGVATMTSGVMASTT